MDDELERVMMEIENQYYRLAGMLVELQSIYDIEDGNYQHRMNLALRRLFNSLDHWLKAMKILIDIKEKQEG